MRILFITTNVVKWGGSEELWSSVAHHALLENHQIMVSTYSHSALPEKVQQLKDEGALLHLRPFPSYVKNQRFFGRLLAEFKMRTGLDHTSFDWLKVKRWKPEVVLISSGETFDYNISDRSFIITYCKKNKVPYFLLSQFNWEHDMDISMAFRLSRARLTKGAAGHFFVSARNMFAAERQLGTAIPQARIVTNPIRSVGIPNPPFPKLSNKLRLACVARVQLFIKGQDVLLQALSHPIVASWNYLLTFYGTGQDEEHLRKLIDFYNLNDKVSIAGHEASLTNIWQNNQLLVLPSRAEGTSLALLEAMYLGRSAIATNVGDSAFWLHKRGYIAQASSPESLRSTILEAFRDRNNWQEKGRLCQEFIQTKAHLDQQVQILKALTSRGSFQPGDSRSDYLKKFQEE